MKNYEGRNLDLRNRINSHLSKLTGLEEDYYSRLKQAELIELKTVLGDIHNVLTFRMTNSAANWLCKYFKLKTKDKNELLHNIDQASPNAKGFDIHITEPYKIVAEIKCISPVKNGYKFGAAQRNSILDDFHKLKYGKVPVLDTTHYFKFLFLIDLGERSTKAIIQLLKETKRRVHTPQRAKRDEVKQHIQLLIDQKQNSLDLKNIYVKILPFED